MDIYQQEVLDNLTERLKNSKKYNKRSRVFNSSELVKIACKGKTHLRKTLGKYPSGKDRLKRFASIAISSLVNGGVLEHISHRSYLLKGFPADEVSEAEVYEEVEVSEADIHEEVEVSEAEVYEEVENPVLSHDHDQLTTFGDDLGIMRTLVNNTLLTEVMEVLERHTAKLCDISLIANQALEQWEGRKDTPMSITLDSISTQLEDIAEVSSKISRIKSHFS